jgi:crotonobetainyl-CoA:carnitine CoA-transferase CaiB-like acyl-CoA transferase
MSSLLVTNGVMAALHERALTGRGQKVEVALVDALVHALGSSLGNHMINGWLMPRTGNRSPYFAPSGIYTCADGGLVFITAPTEKFFRNLSHALDEGWATDPRFATPELRLQNEDALDAELQAICGGLPLDALMTRLVAADVMASPVNALSDVPKDPQVLHNQMIVPLEHPTLGAVRVTGVPVHLGATPGSVRRPPPTLGQHTSEVLAEVGYAPDEIAALEAAAITDRSA